jgi:hypothetical protein
MKLLMPIINFFLSMIMMTATYGVVVGGFFIAISPVAA